MVFFTCNACGESLKKGQVEKHTAVCRNCQCLSCIDCGKDFWGEDYKNHLKCLSEDQKYGGKAFEAKANKGDVKQQQWIERIHEVMNKPSITPNMKNILSQISTYDNIPRKKAKFQNWMKNSLKIHNNIIQDQVWEIFSEATSTTKEAAGKDAPKSADKAASREETSQPSETMEETKKKSKRERKEERQKNNNKKEKKDVNSEEPTENGTKKKGKKRKMQDECQGSDNEDTTDEKKKKKKKRENDGEDMQENGEEKARAKKKRKHEESQEEEVENSVEENDDENSANKGKFNWKGTIKALLSQAPDNELPIKKLRKKVIAQYYTVSSARHKSEEELLGTFNKKIRGNPKFRVLKERVKLIK